MEVLGWILLLTLVVIVMLASDRLIYLIRIPILARRLPGPQTKLLIGNFQDWILPLDVIFDTFRAYCLQFKIFADWIGPMPVVVVHHPDHLKVILGSEKVITKPYHYRLTIFGNGLVTAPDKVWKLHRNLINPAFKFSILDKFFQVFCNKCRILVQKLEKEVGDQHFNIKDYVSKCALDIYLETATGIETKNQEVEGESEFLKIMQMASDYQYDRLKTPWFYPDCIFRRTYRGRLVSRFNTMVEDLAHEVIHRMKTSSKISKPGEETKLSFLDLLLKASGEENYLTEQDVLDEFKTFVIAGHDTTAHTVCWALQVLGSHPEIQEKVYEELQDIFQASDRPPTMKDVSEMKYLDMVLKETMRLYPAIPVVARVSSKDIELDGLKLPAGITLVIPFFLTHRNPDFFPEPEKFDPDNFLPDKEAERHHYAWLPFGAGPRSCIGKKFAMLEMKVVVSSILRNFKLRSAKEKLTPVPQIILTAKEGFYVSISKRTAQT